MPRHVLFLIIILAYVLMHCLTVFPCFQCLYTWCKLVQFSLWEMFWRISLLVVLNVMCMNGHMWMLLWSIAMLYIYPSGVVHLTRALQLFHNTLPILDYQDWSLSMLEWLLGSNNTILTANIMHNNSDCSDHAVLCLGLTAANDSNYEVLLQLDRLALAGHCGVCVTSYIHVGVLQSTQ